jgi:3-oxoacyl-[acyl-carrier-protein] synthase III
MTRAGILGLGLFLPSQVRRNDAWPASFVTGFREHRAARAAIDLTHVDRTVTNARPYEELFQRHGSAYDDDPFKGAIERRIAPDEEPSAHCDAKAGAAALEDAGVHANQIDMVLSSALVPDRAAPSNGPEIQRQLGCHNATAIGVESFCSAGPAQLEIAASLVESGRARFVLCVQSHIVNRANPLEYPSSPIFGDGAGAFVVGSVAGDRGLVHTVRGGNAALAAAVTWQSPELGDAPWWKGAGGAVFPGTSDPPALRELVRNCLAYPIDTVRELCAAASCSLDTIAAVSMIQPLAWYQAAVADGLGIAPERVPTTFTQYGHLGAAAVVANLLEARSRGLLRKGSQVVLYAHGAGLTRYASLVRW